jgi:hypothetical protein
MKRDNVTLARGFARELIIDNFAHEQQIARVA